MAQKRWKKIVFAKIGQFNFCEKSEAPWLAAEEQLFTERQQKGSKISAKLHEVLTSNDCSSFDIQI